jgi:hypothetical protein
MAQRIREVVTRASIAAGRVGRAGRRGHPTGVTSRSLACAAVERACARPGCAAPAVATLTYAYAERAAWLGDLGDDRHPMTYDLCARHADGLAVPQGWHLDDRRRVVELRREPLAS